MNDFITDYFKHSDCKDFKFTGISSAVYLESMVQSYELAQRLGDEKRISCYRNFIDECSAFVLTLQIEQSQSLPVRATGGFLSSPSSGTIRCDNNQHAIMGLMDAYNIGLIR